MITPKRLDCIFSQRIRLIIVTLVGALALVTSVLCIRAAINAYTIHTLSFPMFAPGPLPPGITITGHEVSIYEGEGSTFMSLIYTTNSPNFKIWEVKSSPSDYSLRTFHCPTAIRYFQCSVLMTPSGQAYATQTDYTYYSYYFGDKPTELVVSWLRGDTLIWIGLTKDQVTKYPADVWQLVVEGFTPKDYGDNAIKHYKWQPV